MRVEKLIQICLFSFIFIAASCEESNKTGSIPPINWENRIVDEVLSDTLLNGKTYLSVYSQIYNFSMKQKHNLTATISIRNVNEKDSIYILNATYYDTEGNAIRRYIKKPIFVAPMETLEIVIDESDNEGGTGANFLFEWKAPIATNKPLFEAVMISNKVGLGLSFVTSGVEIK